ncbi:hypothetical protein I5G60_gp16 [Mycobacterium phage Saguaro]|uniref:Uncharacterized protein n=1 Tax=Mycobacterium phage Saguaro TaxID=2315616 RepID=A0A386K9E2_9CAUD|nr:hypothetical protein I5G60_gp16 [Mycobacterium phage Saguaro]AYD82011.1 hypothetical protein SEA_SAGUARO_16 [Mycobacterium phage Saguaro]
MPQGIIATVDDGFATIDFVDPSLRGPALTRLVEIGGPETIETLTRVGPRRQYRVPEGNAREAGLLDDETGEHPRGAVQYSAEDAALESEGGVRGAFTPGNAGTDTGAAAALAAADPNTNPGTDNANWHTPVAEHTSANKYVGETTVTEARAAADPAYTGTASSYGGKNAAESESHRQLIDRVKAHELANPKGAPRGEAAPHAPVQSLNTGLVAQTGALADDPGARPDEGGQARSTYSTVQSTRQAPRAKEQRKSGTAAKSEVIAPPVTAPDTEDVVEYPEGDPSTSWRRDELDAYALKVKGLDTSNRSDFPSKDAVLDAIQQKG